MHKVSPPLDLNCTTLGKLEGKEYKDNRQNGATIQRGTKHVIELAPPGEVPLANDILEEEPNREPRGVVDASGRWDVGHPIQNDGGANPADP